MSYLSSLKSCKTHKEKLHKLYDALYKNSYTFTAAQVQKLPNNPDLVSVKLSLQQSDLKRFCDLPSSLSYLVNKNDKSVINLNHLPQESSNGLVACQSEEPLYGKNQVRFRKGEKNEKDLFIEVWKAGVPMGFQSSIKVSEKVSMVYNDTVFGGIQWSPDGNKIVFVGELP